MWSHKYFRVLCVIELFFLLLEAVAFLKPLKTTAYFPDKFQYPQQEEGIIMDDFPYSSHPGVYLDNALMVQGQDVLQVGVSDLNFSPGSYHVILSYSASDAGNKVTCLSDNNWRSVWRLDNVDLEAGEDVTKVLKMSSLLPICRFSTFLSYRGNGYLYLTSIQIVETRELAIRLLYYGFALFIVVNVFVFSWERFSNRQRKLLLILLGMVFLSSLPIMGMHLGNGDDLEFHLLRIDALAEGLRDGQFPVRVSPYWNNGYGYASSLYYNDLFLLFPALLRLLGISVQSAYKQYILAVNLATVGVAWYSFRHMFERKTALAGTAMFVFLPYRMVCLYKRAAVGEYSAMLFLPLVVWGMYRIYQSGQYEGAATQFERPSKHGTSNKRVMLELQLDLQIIFPLALGLSGLISTHVITTFMTGLIILVFCLIMFRQTVRPRTLWRLITTVLLVFLLNAWFLVPEMDSMRFGIRATVDNAKGHIQRSGTYLFQLFDMFPDADGANYKTFEEIDPAYAGVKDMSFSAGVGIFGLVLWIAYSLLHREKRTQNQTLGNWCCSMGILSLFMSTVWFPWSFLTRTVPIAEGIFGGIQFPWRFLGLAGVFSAVTSMCLLTELQKKVSDRTRYEKVKNGFIILAMASAMWFIHSYSTTVVWQDYTLDNSISTTTIMAAEYLPKEADRSIFDNDQPTPGDGIIIDDYQKRRGVITFSASNTSSISSYADVSFLYYHGYVARYGETGQMLDGSWGNSGRTRIMIPAGYHGKITVQYRERILWRLADLISVLSVMLLILCRIFLNKDNRLEGASYRRHKE